MAARLTGQNIAEISREPLGYDQANHNMMIGKINELVKTVNHLSALVNEYELEKERKKNFKEMKE